MKRWKFGAMSALVAMGGTAIVASSASAASPPWINQIGTSRYDGVGGVAVSSGGSVYVGGTTGGTFPGRSNVGQADAFLAKFNSSGTQRWVRQFGTKGREQVTSVAVASSGDIYVAGYTDGNSRVIGPC